VSSVACIYFKNESGRCPVKEFVEALDRYSQRKFFFVVDLLSEFGHRLPEPHAKFIGDGIFELRFRGVEGSIRIMYFSFIIMKRSLQIVLLRKPIKHRLSRKS